MARFHDDYFQTADLVRRIGVAFPRPHELDADLALRSIEREVAKLPFISFMPALVFPTAPLGAFRPHFALQCIVRLNNQLQDAEQPKSSATGDISWEAITPKALVHFAIHAEIACELIRGGTELDEVPEAASKLSSTRLAEEVIAIAREAAGLALPKLPRRRGEYPPGTSFVIPQFK